MTVIRENRNICQSVLCYCPFIEKYYIKIYISSEHKNTQHEMVVMFCTCNYTIHNTQMKHWEYMYSVPFYWQTGTNELSPSIRVTMSKCCYFCASIFLISKMGSIIKFVGNLIKIHQNYMVGKIVICNKTKTCTQRIGIQVRIVLKIRPVNLAANFWRFALFLLTDCITWFLLLLMVKTNK